MKLFARGVPATRAYVSVWFAVLLLSMLVFGVLLERRGIYVLTDAAANAVRERVVLRTRIDHILGKLDRLEEALGEK